MKMIFPKGIVVVLLLNLSIFSLNIASTSNRGDLELIELGQVLLEDAFDVDVVEDIAYVSDMGTNNRMVIINVSDPSDPQILSEIQVLGSHELYVHEHIAYVANWRYGLEIINVTDPSHPSRIGCFNDGGEIYSVYVHGNLAYAGDAEEEALEIIDIHDPLNPIEVGQFQTGVPYGIDVEKDLAIIGTLANGLVFLNVSNPSSPQLLWESDIEESNPDIEIIGDTAYVSCFETGLRILNISNPSYPEELSHFQRDGEFLALDVINNLACQAIYSQGITIINISDPLNPYEIAHYNDGGKAKGIDVVNDLIFVADHDDGLEIIQIKGYVPTTSTTMNFSSTTTESKSTPFFELHFFLIGLILVLSVKKKPRKK